MVVVRLVGNGARRQGNEPNYFACSHLAGALLVDEDSNSANGAEPEAEALSSSGLVSRMWRSFFKA